MAGFWDVRSILQVSPSLDMRTNRELLALARQSLSPHWPLAIGVLVIYNLLLWGTISFGEWASVLSLVLSGPLTLGVAFFALNLVRQNDARLEFLFDGFKQFNRSFAAYLLTSIFTILWSLLLIVPGIIALHRYALTFYILADQPHLSATEAITLSSAWMDGHKMQLFGLYMLFLGLILLSAITLFVGLLLILPFWHITMAHFYEEVRFQQQSS